jgi:hypothetical protein
MRSRANTVTYRSPEAAESVIMEYVSAQAVWTSFMERAIAFNFEGIFHNMIGMLHFIEDVRVFKEGHSDQLFVEYAGRTPATLSKTHKIISDGIRLFLDYAIELKVEQPDIFEDLMRDYEESDALMNPPG